MGFLKSEGKYSQSLCEKNYINRCTGWRNPKCRMGAPRRNSRALSPPLAHRAPGRGQEEAVCGERKGRLAGSADTSRTSGPHCSSRTPGSRDMLSRRWGVGGQLYFWILPNQKNLGNYENCCVETQTLLGWHRPVYK